jgi:hypothetical protein
MPRAEQEILNDLISKWVPLALEYAKGAPDVSAVYIYASSEDGNRSANAFFEQGGQTHYPSKLQGVETGPQRILQMQKLLVSDLRDAQAEFTDAGVPLPTEYRVHYEPASGKLDVQLSHEIKYANDPIKTSSHGPEDWLDRLPKLYGQYLPKDAD